MSHAIRLTYVPMSVFWTGCSALSHWINGCRKIIRCRRFASLGIESCRLCARTLMRCKETRGVH
jgi:hypothetical protein